MADSPIAKLLLYGSDSPIRDFLTNDANLQAAQNFALGVAATAAAIGSGVIFAEMASGAVGTIGAAAQSGSIATAAAPVAAAGAGVAATNPNLPEEIGEGLEGALPAVENELGTLANEVEGSLPSASPQTEASVLFQARDQAAETARKIVQQQLDNGWKPDAKALQGRFGTLLDALAKTNIRQAVAEGRLPNTFVTSPTVSISRGYIKPWISAPDVWDTATGRAWDFMASNQAAFYRHQADYLWETAFGRLDPGGTIINEIFPLFHQGFQFLE